MSTATTLPADLRAAAAAKGQRLVVSYERISRFRVQQRDVDVEVSRGVDRQAADNDKCAQELGLANGPLPTEQHFTDNDRSASQFATKERERWADLLEFIRGGNVSHVLVWLLDRAYRTTDGAEQLLAACRQGGALIVQTAGLGTICDPSSPDDIFRLKLAGLIAEYEVAKMAQRQRRAKQEAANMGVSHGGRRRFGYEPGMHEVRESEAELVRDITKRLLAGESLASCARDLNDKGVPTPSYDGTCNTCGDQVVRVEGSTFRHVDEKREQSHPALVTRWKGPNLRIMILRPHLAALRVHQRKVVGDAAWPPIISRADHESLKHLLGDPERRTSMSNARVYLLAGLARCAECGEVLRGKTRSKADQRRVYTCATNRHVHRAVEDVDALVEQRIIERLEQSDASGALVDSTAADLVVAYTQRLEALRADRKRKAVELAAAGLDAESITEVMAGYATNIEQVAADLERAREGARRPEVALDGMTGSEAAQAWAGASLGRRRAILDYLTSSITLRGADHGRRRLIAAEDVQVAFRDLSA